MEWKKHEKLYCLTFPSTDEIMEMIRFFYETFCFKSFRHIKNKYKNQFPPQEEIDACYASRTYKSAMKLKENIIAYWQENNMTVDELKIIKCYNKYWVCLYDSYFKKVYDEIYQKSKN